MQALGGLQLLGCRSTGQHCSWLAGCVCVWPLLQVPSGCAARLCCCRNHGTGPGQAHHEAVHTCTSCKQLGFALFNPARCSGKLWP